MNSFMSEANAPEVMDSIWERVRWKNKPNTFNKRYMDPESKDQIGEYLSDIT